MGPTPRWKTVHRPNAHAADDVSIRYSILTTLEEGLLDPHIFLRRLLATIVAAMWLTEVFAGPMQTKTGSLSCFSIGVVKKSPTSAGRHTWKRWSETWFRIYPFAECIPRFDYMGTRQLLNLWEKFPFNGDGAGTAKDGWSMLVVSTRVFTRRALQHHALYKIS